MENPDRDMVLPQSSSRTQSVTLNTGVSSEPQQEPQDVFESNQETPEPERGPPLLEFIKLRIQQLHNRRLLLLNIQNFREKAGDNSGGATEEMNELQDIQKELEELRVKMEELEKQGESSKLTANGDQQDACPNFYKTEPPCGGIYMLPPPKLTQDDTTLEQRVKTRPAAETPTGLVIPVKSLGKTSAVTSCPFCEEVVFTETSSRVGETMWLLCCLFSMLGCVSGCCLIPFFMDRLRNVDHQCPQCQAHIHTYKPL